MYQKYIHSENNPANIRWKYQNMKYIYNVECSSSLSITIPSLQNMLNVVITNFARLKFSANCSQF